MAGLKHVLSADPHSKVVFVWTHKVGSDYANTTLRNEILNLKASCECEVFFMINVIESTQYEHFRSLYAELGHVIWIHEYGALEKTLSLLSESSVCN